MLVKAAANALRGMAMDSTNTEYFSFPTPATSAFKQVVMQEVRMPTGRTKLVPVYMTATITRNQITIITPEELHTLKPDLDQEATRLYLPSMFGGSHEYFNIFTGPVFIWNQYAHTIQSFFSEDDESCGLWNRCVTVHYVIYYKPNSDQPETICAWFAGEAEIKVMLGQPVDFKTILINGRSCWNRRDQRNPGQNALIGMRGQAPWVVEVSFFYVPNQQLNFLKYIISLLKVILYLERLVHLQK